MFTVIFWYFVGFLSSQSHCKFVGCSFFRNDDTRSFGICYGSFWYVMRSLRNHVWIISRCKAALFTRTQWTKGVYKMLWKENAFADNNWRAHSRAQKSKQSEVRIDLFFKSFLPTIFLSFALPSTSEQMSYMLQIIYNQRKLPNTCTTPWTTCNLWNMRQNIQASYNIGRPP